MKRLLHQKNKNKNRKGLVALSQIAILLVAIFSFAWMIGGIESVSADGTDNECNQKGGDCQDKNTYACNGVWENKGTGYECPGGNNIQCCVPDEKENGEGTSLEEELIKNAPPVTPIVTEILGGGGASAVGSVPAGAPPGFFGSFGSLWHIAGAAASAVGFSYIFGELLEAFGGANADWTNAVKTLGLVGGGVGYLALFTSLSLSGLGIIAGGLFLIGALFFSSTVEKGVVFYYCQPWDAPTGGENCALCNKQEVSCSEYQCRSLGQSCEFVGDNSTQGEQPFCFWNNRNDIDPPILSPWEDVLTVGYTYRNSNAVSPPDRGVKINGDSGDGCLSPFSRVTFGIESNEPAKCKLDFQRKNSFDDMANYFGGSQTRKFNHTQTLVIPDLNHTLGHDNQILIYARCQDSNGNSNPHNFVFEMCVQEGPDTTPPIFYGTSIENGASIPFGVTSAMVDVYVNEPAECKWSFIDENYDDMDNNMTCATDPTQINLRGTYTCEANLTGIRTEETTNYFFRCRDQPGAELNDRNTNAESYEYSLIGSRALEIIEVSPNDTVIRDSTNPARVLFEARTLGGALDGSALCYYSDTGIEGTYDEAAHEKRPI